MQLKMMRILKADDTIVSATLDVKSTVNNWSNKCRYSLLDAVEGKGVTDGVGPDDAVDVVSPLCRCPRSKSTVASSSKKYCDLSCSEKGRRCK